MDYSTFQKRYRFDPYKDTLGEGGFGQVYKAYDTQKGYYVAIKESEVKAEYKQFSLKREVELVNELPSHSNIARYEGCYRFNLGLGGTKDFAVLKYYEYGNLEKFLQRTPLSEQEQSDIIAGILHGISFLHGHHVIHRDMKAENILLERENGVWTPKITDFGLSRVVDTIDAVYNSSIGYTYNYAAPEQIQNRLIQKNVDLWSVGVLIYRIVANRLPFDTDSKTDRKTAQTEISRKIVRMELPLQLDTLPEPYQKMIRKCLVFNPQERIQTANELLKYLYDSSFEADEILEGELLEEIEVGTAATALTERIATQIPTHSPSPKPSKTGFKWVRNLILGLASAGFAVYKGANIGVILGTFLMGSFVLGWFVAAIETYLAEEK
jgi:serine/threonine-protein kinase